MDFAGIKVPDTALVHDAMDLSRSLLEPFLFNHVMRSWLFGIVLAESAAIAPDAELLAVAAILHDLGLTERYNGENRFEVDGANAAREFLKERGISAQQTQLVWDAIALHTTIGVAQYKQPVVALVYHGVGFDVMGDRFEELSEETRTQVVSAFPRDGFKNKILYAFLDGFRHKPETTFGNIKSDVCERYLPGYTRPNFCDLVLQSPWNQ